MPFKILLDKSVITLNSATTLYDAKIMQVSKIKSTRLKELETNKKKLKQKPVVFINNLDKNAVAIHTLIKRKKKPHDLLT